MNVIYAYKKNSENKIVYVGQTKNLEQRHKTHIQYDPFNINNPEYNYPLSRDIRKYGEEAYSLIILEDNVPDEQLDEREIYWIKYYNTYFNGYNQSTGGKNPVKPIYDDKEILNVIDLLKNTNLSYQQISEITGFSLTHIYNINTGKRRPLKNINYPIRSSKTKGMRGLKFSQDECKIIHEEILKNDKNLSELGRMFNCSANTISDIVNGKTQAYRLDGYTYPLRNNHSISCKQMWKNR